MLLVALLPHWAIEADDTVFFHFFPDTQSEMYAFKEQKQKCWEKEKNSINYEKLNLLFLYFVCEWLCCCCCIMPRSRNKYGCKLYMLESKSMVVLQVLQNNKLVLAWMHESRWMNEWMNKCKLLCLIICIVVAQQCLFQNQWINLLKCPYFVYIVKVWGFLQLLWKDFCLRYYCNIDAQTKIACSFFLLCSLSHNYGPLWKYSSMCLICVFSFFIK